MIKSSIWSLVVSFCLLLLEVTILSNIMILPVIPDLTLICLLFLSYHNGSVFGEVHGFFAGIFIDLISGSPLGLNSFVRTITGFLAGLTHDKFNADKIFFPIILVILATVVKAFLIFVASIFFGDSIYTYKITTQSLFWIELCFNAILAPVLFRILELLSSLVLLPKSNNYEAK